MLFQQYLQFCLNTAKIFYKTKHLEILYKAIYTVASDLVDCFKKMQFAKHE